MRKMRGVGRGLGFFSCLVLFAAACTFGNGTSQTASTSPESSPSSTTTNPAQSTPVASSPTSEPSTTTGSLAITSLPVHNGEVGVGYLAVSLGASSGTAPYTWGIGSGSLPPGLTLSTDGTISGTSTTAGRFNFSPEVKDSTGATATAATAITVFPALAANGTCTN